MYSNNRGTRKIVLLLLNKQQSKAKFRNCSDLKILEIDVLSEFSTVSKRNKKSCLMLEVDYLSYK